MRRRRRRRRRLRAFDAQSERAHTHIHTNTHVCGVGFGWGWVWVARGRRAPVNWNVDGNDNVRLAFLCIQCSSSLGRQYLPAADRLMYTLHLTTPYAQQTAR